MDWLESILRTQREAKIGELRHHIRRVRRRGRRRRRHARELERQVDELRLVGLALFELLTERALVSNEEVIAKIEEIDLRDGVADGRTSVAGTRERCARCNRVLLHSLERCLYCGSEDADDEPDTSP